MLLYSKVVVLFFGVFYGGNVTYGVIGKAGLSLLGRTKASCDLTQIPRSWEVLVFSHISIGIDCCHDLAVLVVGIGRLGRYPSTDGYVYLYKVTPFAVIRVLGASS